jgi:hypothetical protein
MLQNVLNLKEDRKETLLLDGLSFSSLVWNLSCYQVNTQKPTESNLGHLPVHFREQDAVL